ncbi:GtrA family protein [Lacticaseibacillus thailandensis]|uniref:GtcA family membrane protein n=1 Tax=Lacticaseibacillus thailandensis DSM 22698 = JCM 13996 TaxID=1423810 RepID=A0A0R2C7F3_9LACO|nr:GtrA family protein [Lacticaseibacillus thailandensis]KRM87807.1 GtcA family membrane protein [Lacticaseibacillus thailandensis DSM 22698 = JCM 13996]
MVRELFVKYKSIIAYLFWGVITTIVNIGVFMIWFQLGGNYQVGTVLAWFLSVLVAFFSNKVWVFNSHYGSFSDTLRELVSFFGARLVTLAMDMLITWIGISLLHWDALVVKILDNVIVVIANYVLSKLFVFRKSKDV